MPYSVSPRFVDQSLGPKPTKYSWILKPNRFATRRWPSSWIGITTSRISARNATIASGPPT